MITLTYNQIDGQRGVSSATVTAAAGGVSDWVLAPGSASPLTLTVYPGAGGTATCEITTARVDKILIGTAVWLPWGLGAVTVTTGDTLQGPAVALRLVATGAAATMDVVAGG